MKATILAALVILLSVNVASAQRINPFDAVSSVDTARNTVFLELSSSLLSNSLAVNYEYQFSDIMSVRVGTGAAMQMEGASAVGVTAGLQLFTAGDGRLEGGAGISAVYSNTSPMLPMAFGVSPAVNLGYRYQPVEGGMMFRVGLSYSYNFGFPVQGSAGYAF